jgi:plastocyanin
MNIRPLILPVACAVALTIGGGPHVAAPDAQARATGIITGHVRLTAPAPANTTIRMGADPLCSRANAGKRLTQDVVLRSADGGLANAFVDLQGSFPQTPVPSTPVAIDQRGCIFVPRVVGVRVGQTLRVTNGDPTAHNVHSLSTKGNDFNVSQPKTGMVSTFQLKNADVLRIKCDLHSWMVSYVGVSPHPYFAVSGGDGAFRFTDVPVGRHTIRVWHERYGRLTATVDVKAGATATANFSYTGKEQPSAAGMRDMVVPADGAALTLLAGL